MAQDGAILHEWEMGRGSFQGDPLGGDFFVCAKAQFAAELHRQFPNIWFSWILDDLTARSYQGFVGAEYNPRGSTQEGLGWAAPWLKR